MTMSVSMPRSDSGFSLSGSSAIRRSLLRLRPFAHRNPLPALVPAGRPPDQPSGRARAVGHRLEHLTVLRPEVIVWAQRVLHLDQAYIARLERHQIAGALARPDRDPAVLGEDRAEPALMVKRHGLWPCPGGDRTRGQGTTSTRRPRPASLRRPG